MLHSFNKFNLFQEESPVLYKLYSEQNYLLKGFLDKCIKATMIASIGEAKDVDYENLENHLSENDIFIGFQTKINLTQQEDDLSGSAQVQEFFCSVRSYCEATHQEVSVW